MDLQIEDCFQYIEFIKSKIDYAWLSTEYEKIQKARRIKPQGKQFEDLVHPFAYQIFQSESWIERRKHDSSIRITEDAIKTVVLAKDIKILEDHFVEGLDVKIKELTSQKKDLYEKISFEIAIARAIVEQGGKVKFIETKIGELTPDLLVNNEIEIECKKKDVFTPRDKKIHDFCRQIIRKSLNIMDHVKRNYLVYVKFINEPTKPIVDLAIENIRRLIKYDSSGTFTFNEFNVFIHKIANYNEAIIADIKFEEFKNLQSLKIFESLENLIRKQTGANEIMNEIYEYTDLDDFGDFNIVPYQDKAIVKNLHQVSVKCGNSPDRIRSIVNSIEDGKDQLTGNNVGIVLVQITHLYSRMREKDFRLLRKEIDRVLKNNPKISAVGISSEAIAEKGEMSNYQNQIVAVLNLKAKYPFPHDMKLFKIN